jgi:RNA polymerase sigma-B factor
MKRIDRRFHEIHDRLGGTPDGHLRASGRVVGSDRDGGSAMTITSRTGARDSGITDSAASDRARPAGRGDRTAYEHLAPLFVERAALPGDDPRRLDLRNALVCGYTPVARHIAHRHGHRGENPDDLEQVATVGLILGVDRFQPGRGVEFLSFAMPTITGEVLRYFRDRASTIRVPRRLRALQTSIDAAAAELAQRHGRAARPSEIARHLGVHRDVVLEGLEARYAGHTSSLDEPMWTDDGHTGGLTRYGSALGTVEPDFERVEYRSAVTPLLEALPERERRILLLRFFGG